MKYLLFLALLTPSIVLAQDCTNCEKKGTTAPLINNKNLSDIQKATIKELCSSRFDEKLWDKFVNTKTDIKKLDENDYYFYLLRFAKPGGFNPESDLHREIFRSILMYKPEVRKNYPKEYAFALQQVYSHNAVASWDYDDYTPYPIEVDDEESCQTKEEKDLTRQKAFEITYKRISDYGVNNPICEVPKSYRFLLPSLKKLDEEKKNAVIKPLYRALGACLTERSYGSIFISKSLVFTKSYVKSLFGQKQPILTDLSNTHENDFIVTLSNYPMRRNQESTAGVYVDYHQAQKNLSWTIEGKSFTAKINSEKHTLREYVPEGDSPDYKKMWEDKKLTGMTLVSPNLGDTKDRVTSQYISYYTDQGFEFSEPVDNKDVNQWLKDKISSGEIDYILKEAHAGGNQNDLIGLSMNHKIMTGKKKKEDGTEEVMYILMPQDDHEATRVSFAQMSELMKEREEQNKGPLIYLNSSCWSAEQAKSEIPGIKSKLFVDIPSAQTSTTFFNGKNSTKYHIMQGLRDGKSYNEMLEGMKTTTRHQNGYNDFLFPNSERYHTHLQTNKKVIHRTFEIKDDKGKIYTLQDAAAAH